MNAKIGVRLVEAAASHISSTPGYFAINVSISGIRITKNYISKTHKKQMFFS